MTPRVRFSAALSVVLTAALSAGCYRVVSVPASAKGGGPAAATDYRTLGKDQLQDFIKSQIGVDGVALTAKGEHTYTGTLTHLDGTTLPVEVTVEARRIVCETKTPAGSTRQVITPQGVTSDLNVR
jgi:hypothetical protein